MRQCNRTSMGIALIEALVALAVMAFGMLAVAGVQVTLRQNADIAKQRSEAVRLAQAEIERWRAFTSIAGAAGTVTYLNLVTDTLAAVSGSNAQFTVARSVDEPANLAYKMLRVDVSWVDRNGQAQNVRLSTAIHRVAPELAGTVSVLGGASGLGYLNPAIPPGSTLLTPTTSGFRPPQGGVGDAVAWVFNNTTGLITVCTTNALTTATLAPGNIRDCSAGKSQLLSGYISFATGPAAPTAAEAEVPPSASLAVTMQVLRTLPAALAVSCFTEQFPLYVSYYCAVPVSVDLRWSGRSVVGGLASLTGTDEPLSFSAAELRVCRYTRYQDNRTVASGTITNAEHPLDYAGVNGPLANQNFLIIRAGDGASAFACTADNPATLVDTTTWRHPLS